MTFKTYLRTYLSQVVNYGGEFVPLADAIKDMEKRDIDPRAISMWLMGALQANVIQKARGAK